MHAAQPEHDAPIRRTSRDRYPFQLPSRVSCKCQKVVGIYENKTMRHTTTGTSAATHQQGRREIAKRGISRKKRHSIIFVSKQKPKKQLKSTFRSFSHRTPRPNMTKETNMKKKSIHQFIPSVMHASVQSIAPAKNPYPSSCFLFLRRVCVEV
jgi:hypothetical protein